MVDAERVHSAQIQDERYLIRNSQPPAERVIFIRPKHRVSPHLRNVAHHDRFGYANVLRHVSRYALGDRDNAVSSASQPTLHKYAKVENIGTSNPFFARVWDSLKTRESLVNGFSTMDIHSLLGELARALILVEISY